MTAELRREAEWWILEFGTDRGKTVEIEHCLKKANNILMINALNECTCVNFRF